MAEQKTLPFASMSRTGSRRRPLAWLHGRALAASIADIAVIAAFVAVVASGAPAAPPVGTFHGCPQNVRPLPSQFARYEPDVKRVVLQFVRSSFGSYAKETRAQLAGARIQTTVLVRDWLPSGWVKIECGQMIWARSVASTVYFPQLDKPQNPKGHCNACAAVTLLTSLTQRGWTVWARY